MDKFWSVYDQYIKRDGAKELKQWMLNQDVETAPASTRYHESYAGGLKDHSVRVWEELIRLLKAYPEVKCSGETAAICALLHDLAKLNFYGCELRNKKEDGVWRQVPVYVVKERTPFGGHGSKSVYLIQKFMQLTDEEACAINSHMGPEGGNTYIYDVYRASPLSFLLHSADMAATINFKEARNVH